MWAQRGGDVSCKISPRGECFAGVICCSRRASSALVAFLLALSMVACAGGPRVTISNANGVKAVVRVEVADTAASRELGLMYRQHLGQDAGMLFVFKQPRHLIMRLKKVAGAEGSFR